MREQLGLHAAVDGSIDILHEDGGTGLANERKRYFIEEGCLHFVRDHRSSLHASTYRTLVIAAVAMETTLDLVSVCTQQLGSRARLISRLLNL
jgi:hypothetical protein